MGSYAFLLSQSLANSGKEHTKFPVCPSFRRPFAVFYVIYEFGEKFGIVVV